LTQDDTASIQKGNAYDKYASKNPIERRLMAGFFRSLDELTPGIEPTTILEVGVGEGEVASRLAARWPSACIVGIDLPDDALASHWRDAPLAGAFADIARLPFPDSSFDLVLAIEVLEHVPDPPAALRELARVARRDVVISVPREPIWRLANMGRGKYLSEFGNTPGHINHWSKRAFVSMVSSELAVREVRVPFPWTMVAAELQLDSS
jgi:SAM-dependent methyltransferase